MRPERTLIVIKHDGILRCLVGEIIRRFENTGLKIIGMKMRWPDDKIAGNHYLITDAWANALYEKARTVAEKRGENFQFKKPKEYAEYIQSLNKKYLKEGPVIAIVFEGYHAVGLGRKLVGNTEPRQALPGTIRGDFTLDSYALANLKKRSVRNIIHASGTVEEAEREIRLWFREDELHDYKKELDKHYG